MPALRSSISLILISILMGPGWVLKEQRGSFFHTSFAPERILITKVKKKHTLWVLVRSRKSKNQIFFPQTVFETVYTNPKGLYLNPLAESSMFHGMVGYVRCSASPKCSSELGMTDQLPGFSPRSNTAAVCLSVSKCVPMPGSGTAWWR